MRNPVSTLLAILLAWLVSFSVSAAAPTNVGPYTLPYTFNEITYTKALMTKTLSNDSEGGNVAAIYFYNGTAKFNGGYSVFKFFNSPTVLRINSVDDVFGNSGDVFHEYTQSQSPDDPYWFGLANDICFTDAYLKGSNDVRFEAGWPPQPTYYQNSGYHCNYYFYDNEADVVVNSDFFNFKMKLPLPGGVSWRLNTKIGGDLECTTQQDSLHQGNGYYSLDFGHYTAGNTSQSNINIYATADGIIDGYGYDANGFGNWVRIDHLNGYMTLYGHMANQTSVTSGFVPQGTQLGIMGTTGNSTGIHLHLQIYYGGSSTSTVTELGLVKMEGLFLNEYTVITSSGNCHTFYPSTNTQ